MRNSLPSPNNLSPGALKQALLVACGLALLATGVPLTMALGSSFTGNTALVVLPAAQQLVPRLVLTDTATTTATSTVTTTGTVTVTATLTRTATPTATGVVTGTGTVVATGTVTETKVTICHRTGSASNPYVLITVSQSALPAHRAHGDIIPAPPGGCLAALTPAASVTATTTATTTTTTTTTTPSVSATPLVTSTSVAYKVPVCHVTGSKTHSYVLITVDQDALPAHRAHGDLVPAPPGGCPVATQPAVTQPKSNGNHGNNGNNGNANKGKANSPAKAPAKTGQGNSSQGKAGPSAAHGNSQSNNGHGNGADTSDKGQGHGKKP